MHRPNQIWPDGAQVDLLIDRADNTINLVEIKFSQGEFTITKSYAAELRRKVAVFKGVTATRKNVFLTFFNHPRNQFQCLCQGAGAGGTHHRLPVW